MAYTVLEHETLRSYDDVSKIAPGRLACELKVSLSQIQAIVYGAVARVG